MGVGGVARRARERGRAEPEEEGDAFESERREVGELAVVVVVERRVVRCLGMIEESKYEVVWCKRGEL